MQHILILEDEPFIAMDLQMAFEDAGFAAHTAIDCAEAFDIIAENDPMAAVLDVNLGQGQTCKEVALELQERAIPYALHTGDLDRAGEFIRGLGAPSIAKPRPAEDVVSFVLKLMDGVKPPQRKTG